MTASPPDESSAKSPPASTGTILGAALIFLGVYLACRAAGVPEGYGETRGTTMTCITFSGNESQCVRYMVNGHTYGGSGVWGPDGSGVTVRYRVDDPSDGRPVYFLERWGLALLLGLVGVALVARGPGSEKP
jgi:hypothetical protein